MGTNKVVKEINLKTINNLVVSVVLYVIKNHINFSFDFLGIEDVYF
jgi:hypothetical protein